jgi:ribosome-interacting GTPase 1
VLPANLTAEAQAKWQEAQSATNPREKLRAYQEFLSAIPKHKGNERLQAQIKTKIAELKDQLTIQRGKPAGARPGWTIEREGAAQIMLVGRTNAGRSSILKSITNAQVIVAAYEFTTQTPVPGMLHYEDIQLQLVEVPAPQLGRDGLYELEPEALDLIRPADGLVIVVDMSDDPATQFLSMVKSLGKARISTQRPLSRVEIVREKGSGEIRIATSGQTLCSPAQIRELMRSYGIRNALVRIYGEASLKDVEDAIFENVMLYKPTMVLANKIDLVDTTRARLEFITDHATTTRCVFTSCLTGKGLSNIGENLFSTLGIIRVYTKEPSESRPSKTPFVVRVGTTLGELARQIHTDLADRYRYSRIWGPTSKFAGERVGPDHVLADQDIVEIHAA